MILRALLFVAAAIFLLTAQSMRHGWALLNGALMLCFVALVVLVVLSLGAQTRMTRQRRLLLFYDDALARAEGTRVYDDAHPQRTGLEVEQNLRPVGHLYERDLDLLGNDSLFSMLATMRTGLGESGLAAYLLHPATHEETLRRQEAVKELLPQVEIREKIALLGTSTFQQISASYFENWLKEDAPYFFSATRWLLLVTALVNVFILLVGITHFRPWGNILPYLLANLLAQGLVCYFLRPMVLPLLAGGAKLEGNIKMLSEGLALMQAVPFVAPKLVELQRRAMEPAGAVKQLGKLRQQLEIVEQRPKEYFLLFSLLLAAGTQAAMSIAKWKRKHAVAMRGWLAAWAEFEALQALATYAFEHPENAWPELLPATHAPVYEAVELAHPLLAGAVANDVRLDDATRFLLISGSNMSGKSTMMRSVGINAVLAYAGAPVCARTMRLTPLVLGASLALTDSLAEGKSKFKAEVERLAAVVVASKESPVLFLVDEIFSGTNSADRKTAADAVLRALLQHGAIGALSTHDLLLTELAREENGGVNVHMASPDEEDPLAFDYKLKAGVNTSSNAMAIVRMMGLG